MVRPGCGQFGQHLLSCLRLPDRGLGQIGELATRQLLVAPRRSEIRAHLVASHRLPDRPGNVRELAARDGALRQRVDQFRPHLGAPVSPIVACGWMEVCADAPSEAASVVAAMAISVMVFMVCSLFGKRGQK